MVSKKIMSKYNIPFIFILFILSIVGCAKRGSITGGSKDTLAPILNSSFPKNLTTNFKGNEIKLVFNEYVKLKNINKQLVISPPMKRQPDFLPQTASKVITIKLKDTLKENTTYSMNFGQSIEDNNEGNPYSQFKYVFSTGTYIDSLKLNVKVKDAIENKTDNFVSVMLYEINEKFNDSTIYKEAPRYVTNTLDSLKIVTIDNIKAGKYLLIALKDNGNNKFNPSSDKIGFQKYPITIPNDTLFELDLFKEKLKFKALKPTQASGNKIIMGYEGNPKNIKVTLKNGVDIIPNIVTKLPKKDSVQVWFKPIKTDSVTVSIEKDNFNKNFTVKLKNLKKDTLSLSPLFSGSLPFRERFGLVSSTPLLNFDISKISILNKDSLAVDFKMDYDEFEQKLILDFKKEELENYKIKFLPGALTDYFDKQNDTLKYNYTTKNSSEYGNLKVILENVKRFPVIIELTDKEGKVKETSFTELNSSVEFLAIEPNKYWIRVIYDDNKNKEWDAGDFIEKRQSEEVIYFPKEIEVRANWDVEQPFSLGAK